MTEEGWKNIFVKIEQEINQFYKIILKLVSIGE